MSHSKKGNRFQISFKENIQEIELMNFMLKESEILGISTYIKTLIADDKKKKESESKK